MPRIWACIRVCNWMLAWEYFTHVAWAAWPRGLAHFREEMGAIFAYPVGGGT